MSLVSLFLGDNELSGSISTDIGKATSLQLLGFQQNLLEGTIPTEIADMEKLMRLQMEFNLFEGPIPTEIGNMNRLGKQTKKCAFSLPCYVYVRS